MLEVDSEEEMMTGRNDIRLRYRSGMWLLLCLTRICLTLGVLEQTPVHPTWPRVVPTAFKDGRLDIKIQCTYVLLTERILEDDDNTVE